MIFSVRRGGGVAIHLFHLRGAYRDRPHEKTFCPKKRRLYVLAAATLASSMGFMDRIVISIAMPSLRADLGSTLADAQWISNAYLLAMVSLIMLAAALGERFGLRLVFGGGVALFTLAAGAGALAPTTEWLIAFRAVQGVGAALMVPGSLSIVAKAYPKSERGKAIGIWASASSLMLIIGPLVGGAVIGATDDWGWRVLFGLNVAFGVVVLTLLLVPVPADPVGRRRHFDFPGAGLITAALFLVAFGLTGEGDMGSVPSTSRVLLFGGGGLALLALFVWAEARSKEPMMPVGLFANPGFSGANAVTFLTDFVVSTHLFFLPMAAITGWGADAAAVAVLFLPLPIFLTLMSEPAGQLADRFGPAPLVTVGCIVLSISCAGLAFGFARHDVWVFLLPLMGLMAIGQGMIVSPLSTAVMTQEGDEDIIAASAVNNGISRAAWLIAVAAMGGVAAVVYGGFTGTETTSFGAAPGDIAGEAVDLHVAATDAVYFSLGAVTAVLAAAAAVIAALTLNWTSMEAEPERG